MLIPNFSTSAGGFADRISAIMANRQKIDQERELKRQKDAALARLAEISQNTQDVAEKAAAERLISQLPKDSQEAAAIQADPTAYRDGYVWNGKVYKSHDQMVQANREAEKMRLLREAAKNKGDDWDAKQSEFTQKQKETQRLREGALAELKLTGASPDAETHISKFYDDQVAQAQAELNAYMAANVGKDGKPLAGAGGRFRATELDALTKAVEEAKGRKDMAQGEGASYARSHRAYEAGITEDIRDLLEAQLVTNPVPAPTPRGMRDLYIDRELERITPEIIKLGAIVPDQVKTTMDWIKGNRAQGDAAAKAEVNSYEKEKDRSTALLKGYKAAEASAARDSNNLLMEARKLAQKGEIEAAKRALGYAKLANDRWRTNHKGLVDQTVAHIRGGYGVMGNAVTTQAYYTEEGNAQIESQMNRNQQEIAQVEDQLYGTRTRHAGDLVGGGNIVAPTARKIVASKKQPGKYFWSDDVNEVNELPITVAGYAARMKADEEAKAGGARGGAAKAPKAGGKGAGSGSDVDSFGTPRPVVKGRTFSINPATGRWRAN